MFYTYVLMSTKTDKWYTDFTNDLRKRIVEHNTGLNTSTKFGAPWKIIYYEASLHKKDTRAREKYLKSGMGKRYFKNRLKFFFA